MQIKLPSLLSSKVQPHYPVLNEDSSVKVGELNIFETQMQRFYGNYGYCRCIYYDGLICEIEFN